MSVCDTRPNRLSVPRRIGLGLRSEWRVRLLVHVRKGLGTLLTINWLVLWAAPVILQGQALRHGLGRIARPVYRFVDRSSAFRRFAVERVYRRAKHADYFAAGVLLAAGTICSLVVVFAWQIAFGSLPWWLVAAYYLAWVGPGGRGIAVAWTLAHREGHHPGGRMYRGWFGARIGNFFENWLGNFYGTVPYNFSTSHLLLHHRLNAGKGDPVYLWDLDRTSFGDMMLYQWRWFRYMTGIGSLVEFRRQRGVHPAIDSARATLKRA